MNENGSEYAGDFKVCIPVRNTPKSGNITFNANATITQFNIYFANNQTDTEQSFIIADPMYAPMSCTGTMKWDTVTSPYGRLVVNKVDGMGNPLQGAIFKLTGAGTKTYEGTSDSTGQIIWEYLDPTISYTLSETQAPAGYIKAEDVTVNVLEGTTTTVSVKNLSERTLRIRKVDAQNGNPLIGATFRVEQVDGTFKTDVTTGHSGYIEFEGSELSFGSYKIYEINAPEGYEESKEVQTVEWNGAEDITLVFENVRTPSFTIIKKDKDTNIPLEDVSFDVFKDGKRITTVTTNSAGYAYVSGLTEGYYEVREKAAPEGYILDTEKHGIHINPYDPAVENDPILVLTNSKKPTLIIEKLDTKTLKPIKNTTFAVYKDTKLIGNYTTDANGLVELTDLEPGTYTVKETKTAGGYVLQNVPQSIELELGKTATLTFFNPTKPGISIKKIDADTGDELQGAVFKVEGVNVTYLNEFTTDKDGGFIIRKLDSITKQPLSGAEFTVTTSDGKFIATDGGAVSSNGIYTTDELGQIHITNIEAGTTVVVTETKAPDGYVIDTVSKTVKIDADDTQTLTFYNKPSSSLIITKLDKETKEPLYGAVFEITDSTGAVVGTSNGRYTTDIYGNIKVNGLTPGTYVITEVEAPAGYAISGEPQTINVVSGKIHNLTFYNSPEGGLIITKLDKATGEPIYGAVFKVTNSEGTVVGNANGRYTTNRNGIIHLTGLVPDTYVVTEVTAPEGYTLDGASQTVKVKSGQTHELTFLNEALGGIRITKLDEETRQPIKGVKFEVEYMNGKRIGTYTTNASGVINIDDLPNGWYTVTETKAADDYILDAEPHDVEVTDGEITRVTITNRKNSSFLIHKVDSTTGKGISGVTFLISDRYGRPLAQYVSDQNGYVYTDNDKFEDGKYYIREIAVPSGYVLDTEVKTFYVEYGHTSSITWYNTPIQAQIQIIKKSADDNPINGLPAGSLLEGAVFEIYDKAGNIVDTIKTDKNGRAMSKPLPLGIYTMRETSAPAYYTPNGTLMTAHLEFNGQIMTFEVLNKSVSVGVSVTKYGYNEVMPDNPIVYSFKNIANTSSISLDSFYFRDTLPSAIRAEKIVTGTFNQNLSYKIVYLTNLSGGEYRTINDNLSTSKNYVIDVSNIALGLAENEYITEIMYVFGSVRAGFAQVETPYLYARSVKGLANGGVFVNTADVGGVYNGQWITTISRFVTKVYSYTYIEMPKTGY